MLIEFSVGNYKSFKEKVTFSMVAANINSRFKNIDETNVFKIDDDLSLLTSAAIYGANASGKSNLIAAIRFMRSFIMNSSRESQANDPIAVEHFLLSTETEGQPSFFEIVFISDGTCYRYGFKVTKQHIVSEWLYYVRTIREVRLFERHLDEIKLATSFKEGRSLPEKTRSNALFLSVVTQFNGATSISITRWFRNLNVSLGVSDVIDRLNRERFLGNLSDEDIVEFIRKLDIDINSLKIEKEQFALEENVPENLKAIFEVLKKSGAERTVVQTFHRKSHPNGETSLVAFNLDEQESAGTQKLFALAYPILSALRKGRIIIVDELDARLHPLITREIINLFNSKETNPRHAQLVFTTHDTNLLSNRMFRRDQIWFTEKNRQHATRLYSLVEYKVKGNASVRNDASFEKDYIEGRYGAIPFIGDFRHLLGVEDGENEPEKE